MNRELESYCKHCSKYLGMSEVEFDCPICRDGYICNSKECNDKHHEECEKPYIEWIEKRDDIDELLKSFGGYDYWKSNDERFDELSVQMNDSDGFYNSHLSISYWYNYEDKYKGNFTLNGIIILRDTVKNLIRDWNAYPKEKAELLAIIEDGAGIV